MSSSTNDEGFLNNVLHAGTPKFELWLCAYRPREDGQLALHTASEEQDAVPGLLRFLLQGRLSGLRKTKTFDLSLKLLHHHHLARTAVSMDPDELLSLWPFSSERTRCNVQFLNSL